MHALSPPHPHPPHSFPNTPTTLSPPPYNKTQTMHMNTDMSSCDCFCWCCCVFCCLICFHDSMLYTASSSHVSAVLLIVPVGDKRKLFCMFLILPTVLCSALPWHRYLLLNSHVFCVVCTMNRNSADISSYFKQKQHSDFFFSEDATFTLTEDKSYVYII